MSAADLLPDQIRILARQRTLGFKVCACGFCIKSTSIFSHIRQISHLWVLDPIVTVLYTDDGTYYIVWRMEYGVYRNKELRVAPHTFLE